AGG
ncbi:DNA topoisomerase family protein, partial [Chlamydia suis MD56]